MIRVRPRLVSCALLALTLSACGGATESTNTNTVPTLTTVSVSLSVTTIRVGQSALASAKGADQNGKPISLAETIWSSSAPDVATVGASGIINAVAAGQATITARSGAKTGSANIVVQPFDAVGDFSIVGAQFTQGVQAADGSIPMVLSGNAAAVNVLVRAPTSQAVAMQVALRIFDASGALVRSDTATTGLLGPTPSYDAPTVQFLVPASVLKPGLRWQVVRDPKHVAADDSLSTDVFPRTGSAALSVVDVPPLNIRFVPITLAAHGNATGAITASDFPEYLWTLKSVHPLGVVNAHVGAPLVTNASFGTAPSGGKSEFWQQVISELDLARITDPTESEANWYGIVVPPPGFNYTSFGGYSYIPTSNGPGAGTRTSASVQIHWFSNPTQARELVAHEIGHTFGRSHAPCGGAGAPLDPTFPTVGGTLDQPGHNVYGWAMGYEYSATTIPTSRGDVMGYCSPPWASTYTYRAVLAFRGSTVLASRTPEPMSRVLVVRGRVIKGTSIALEPAFVLNGRPTPPGSGDYTLAGLDDKGATLFSASFTPFVLDHSPDVRPFTIALPSTADIEDRLASIVVRGPAGEGRMDSPVSASVRAARDVAAPAIKRIQDGSLMATCGDTTSRGIVVLDRNGAVLGSAAHAQMRLVAAAHSPVSIVCSDGVRTNQGAAVTP